MSTLAKASVDSADLADARSASLRRLRWRSRRGLLENDLVLERFLDRHGGALDGDGADALACLLSLPDGELLDLMLGRCELEGELDRAPVRDMLGLLRQA
jgi:antitoxin CptB